MSTDGHRGQIADAAERSASSQANPLRGAHQVAVPAAARAVSTLARIDYEDAFLVQVGDTRGRMAEQWARAVLDEAPIITRKSLPWGWRALGLRIASTRSERFVHGWGVRLSTPDCVLLGAGSRIGMPAELLLQRRQRTLLFATFVELDSRLARVLWAGIEDGHRRVVRYVLQQAAFSSSHAAPGGAPG